MSDQLVFDLPVKTAFGREDYFVSEANALVVAQVREWKAWVNGRLVLSGPTGSGKTHLATIWAGDVGAEMLTGGEVETWRPKAFPRAVAIDAVDQETDETALLFLLNALRAENLPVLCVMERPASYSDIALPDLRSRLEASSNAELKSVDDALRQAVFLKLAHERQLVMQQDVMAFALKHGDRDLTATEKLIEAIDRMSLRQKKAVTKRLVTEAVGQLKQGEEHE